MPKRKGNKRNSQKKNKSNKSPKKATSNTKNKSSAPSKKGKAFSKEILQLLNQLTSVLREVDQLKGSPLYETAIKLDELTAKIIALQSNPNANINNKKLQIWGFESIKNETQNTLLNRLKLWIKSQQNDTFIDDNFTFKSNLKEGRGVVALKDLKKGTPVMSIHRKLMITHTYALTKSDEKIRRFLIKDPLCKQVPSLAMVLYLWYERNKGSKSFWKPYIDSLPLTFNLPHECRTADLIPFLRGSLILDKVIRLKINHLKHYTYSRVMLHRSGISPGLRLIDYLWSTGVIMTRQNRIPLELNKNESELALIPCWDMCNYKSGKITTYFNTKQQKNEMYLMNNVAKNEQIYIYYGGQRNELLYLNSGFVQNNNPNDEIELNLKLNIKDPLYKIKEIQIKNAQLTNPIKCLLPIVNYKQFDDDNENLNEAMDFVLNKEKNDNKDDDGTDNDNDIYDDNKQQPQQQQLSVEEQVFGDSNISTKWMLSVYDQLGLSVPPPAIQFARIATMNKDEVMKFMQAFLEKKKKLAMKDIDDNKPVKNIINQPVDGDDDGDNQNDNTDLNKVEIIKLNDDDYDVKEVINVENEIKSWNLLHDRMENMYRFFTKTLIDCKTVHCPDNDNNNDNDIDLDTVTVLKQLKDLKQYHVALAFELLNIEREHYFNIMKVLKEGLKIIEKRLIKVLKPNDNVNINDGNNVVTTDNNSTTATVDT